VGSVHWENSGPNTGYVVELFVNRSLNSSSATAASTHFLDRSNENIHTLGASIDIDSFNNQVHFNYYRGMLYEFKIYVEAKDIIESEISEPSICLANQCEECPEN
jgi:hypothetical protein